MNQPQFDEVTSQFIEKCKALLLRKGIEYNLDEDRLEAFKTSAMLLHTTTKKALLGYLTKHIISIYDMIGSEKKFNKEKWDEKIIDIINYLLLLNALITEEEEASREKN